MKPKINYDRTKWTKGFLTYDFKNRVILCVTVPGKETVGHCPFDMPEVMVKRWIIKVGEFKQVDILNQDIFVKEWNRRMVDDDDDKYNGFKKQYRTPGQSATLQKDRGPVQQDSSRHQGFI
jgi:hypothetical protein